MNGELYQLCQLTTAAKSALFGGSEFEYEPIPYENKIEFLFRDSIKECGANSQTAESPDRWYEHLTKKGLRDIKLITPTEVGNRSLLGFANAYCGFMLCYFKNSEITAFIPKWEFDQELKMWNILYTEQLELIPYVKPHCEDNTDDLREILIEIEDLAERIDCGGFAKRFELARNILDGNAPLGSDKLRAPKIPQKLLPLFYAADAADVFGAMGSWNDSPPYMAHEKGLDKEYDELSARLLKNIRLAVLYAVNEWR